MSPRDRKQQPEAALLRPDGPGRGHRAQTGSPPVCREDWSATHRRPRRQMDILAQSAARLRNHRRSSAPADRQQLFVALALLMCAKPAGALAAPGSSAALKLSSRNVTGGLLVTASTNSRTATVTAKGILRVRHAGVRLVVLRCAHSRCGAPSEGERASRLLARGTATLRQSLHVSRAPAVSVQVRVNGRAVATRVLVPALEQAPAPVVNPSPAPGAPGAGRRGSGADHACGDHRPGAHPGLRPPDHRLRRAVRAPDAGDDQRAGSQPGRR